MNFPLQFVPIHLAILLEFFVYKIVNIFYCAYNIYNNAHQFSPFLKNTWKITKRARTFTAPLSSSFIILHSSL